MMYTRSFSILFLALAALSTSVYASPIDAGEANVVAENDNMACTDGCDKNATVYTASNASPSLHLISTSGMAVVVAGVVVTLL
ncbi:hypothetical protein JAAARDRAFT_61618 [Jaapia argillacea MUCL 33604]|uniref:Uncharacterized protein n=1 Tax=Jaapia argillacea MUCL 33604 TaxID=933084 RepID=A0A067PR57_9AGAM|nr:hypothetical protein JAAARDRAFT_61618 [Jaapia argillacea MUCL 33604]